MEKEALIQNVKEWMKLDTELARLQNEAREIKKQKNNITENITNVMRTNNIDCLDVNDNSLIYKRNVIKQPISKKMLLKSLQQFYENIGEDDKDIVEKISTFVLESRSSKIKETIKRKV